MLSQRGPRGIQLTNICLQICRRREDLWSAGEVVQSHVSEPLTRESGGTPAPGQVHHGEVRHHQPGDERSEATVTSPGIAVKTQTVKPLQTVHRLLPDLLDLVVVELQPLQLGYIVKCPRRDLLYLTAWG